MNKTILWIIIVIVVVGGVWYIANKEQVLTEKEVIKIGYIGPLSGPGAVMGQTELNSIEIAVDEINSKRGRWYTLDVVPEDGKCEGKEAATAANKLVNVDGVKVILGGTCSSETIAAAPITEANEVLLITDLSSNPSISDLGEFIFRLTPTDKDFYGPAAEILFNRYDVEEIAVISENTDYGQTALEAFIERFEELGGVVVKKALVNPDQRDYKTEITKIKSTGVGNIMIIPQTPQTGGLIAKQIKELAPQMVIYGGYLMEHTDAIQTAQGALEGAVVVSVSKELPSNRSKNVYEQYKERYGEEPGDFISLLGGYDRAYLVAEALDDCGVLDTQCMQNFLYSNRFDLSLGKYGFNEKGDIDTFYIGILEIKEGEAISVEPILKFSK